MSSVQCFHGSYEEFRRDVPQAQRDEVHYSTTTPGQGFVCAFFDGMDHIWVGQAMPPTFLADFPKASSVSILYYQYSS